MLSKPSVGGMAYHPEVYDVAFPQFNDDEDEERTEEQIMGLQYVAGPYLAGMVVDACPDGLSREGSPGLLR